jgi:hypothetical protein
MDYATAQNIFDQKVAIGENQINESLRPVNRLPTGGHTVEEVVGVVRLMNDIAQAR